MVNFEQTAGGFAVKVNGKLIGNISKEHGFFIYDSTIHIPLLIKPAASLKLKTRHVPEPVETTSVAPTLLRAKDSAHARAVHEVEVFGPAATIVPYRDEQEATTLVARGGGSLVASLYGEDHGFLNRMVGEIGPLHGRLLLVDPAIAGAHTGHGNVMPQCNHGGPGRAGNGEELGGLSGLRLYLQRVAVQGSTEMLATLQASAANFR